MVVACAFTIGYSHASHHRSVDILNDSQAKANTTSYNIQFDKRGDERMKASFQQLADFSRFDSHFALTVALCDLLVNANASEVQQYWDESKNFEAGQIRQHIQGTIVQRWAALEPLAALTAVSKVENQTKRNNWFDFIFREWSRVNLDELLHYSQDVDQTTRDLVVGSILREREDFSPKELRGIARNLDNEWLVFEYIDDLVANPEFEWVDYVAAHREHLENLSENQEKVLQNLAFIWLSQSGVSAFQKLNDSLPSTFSLYEMTAVVSRKLLETNPNLAIDFVVDRIQREQDHTYKQLAVELIIEWTKVDSIAAFNYTEAIDARGLRQKMQNWAIIHWARHNPATLIQEIENLPPRLHTFAHTWALREFSSTSPKEALVLLDELTIGSTLHREVVQSLAGGWIQQDFDSALEWIKTEQSIGSFRDEVMKWALTYLAETNPDLAIHTALQTPLSGREFGLESEVVRAVASDKGNIDKAISLLTKVRAGTTRSRAYDSVIFELLKKGDTNMAMNLFFELSAMETEDLVIPLATIARKSPSLLYDSLVQIEDVLVQSEAARLLYYHNKDTGRFKEDELEHLNDLIQSQPISRMNRAYDRMNEVMQESR